MKIILSRKGFDSGAGGCASPIIGDRLISLPIPEKYPGTRQKPTYEDLSFEYEGKNYTYAKLLGDLKNSTPPIEEICHLDPDINEKAWREKPEHWKPAFGPYMRTFGKHLENENVKKGDIFLFFGWFREVVKVGDSFRYREKSPDIHAIYGYLQICEILEETQDKKSRYPWHPHAEEEGDCIIVPTLNLKLKGKETKYPGYGLFKYSDKIVLTDTSQDDCKRSLWNAKSIFNPTGCANYVKMKDQKKEEYFYKRGRWQEYIYDNPTDDMLNWLECVLEENRYFDK